MPIDLEKIKQYEQEAKVFLVEREKYLVRAGSSNQPFTNSHIDSPLMDTWDELELLREDLIFSIDRKKRTYVVEGEKTKDTALQLDKNGLLIKTHKTDQRNRIFKYGIAAAILLALLPLTTLYYGIPKTYQVAKGSSETVRFTDGSQIFLGSGSVATTREGWGRRRVELERGAAYFSVISNYSKPFVVDTGETSVRVLGTSFTVYRKGLHVEVVVESGKVNVSNESLSSLGQQGVELAVNEKLTIESDGKLVRVPTVDINDELSWKSQIVHFNNRPLHQVVSRMNDYFDEPIYIMNKSLKTTNISGSFGTEDIDSFLQAIALLIDGKIERNESGAVLIF